MTELDQVRVEIRDAMHSLFRSAHQGRWEQVADLADRLIDLEKRQAELVADSQRPSFDG